MSERLETLAADDWHRSKLLHSSNPAQYIGRYTMGDPSSNSLPIDANNLYQTTSHAIDSDPHKAREWARTFGKLSIAITSLPTPDRFLIEPINSHIPHYAAELKGNSRQPVTDLVSSSAEHDSSRTYLIFDNYGKPITPEMAMIQLLHLVDSDIVTGQMIAGKLPSARIIDADMLAKLRSDNPEVLLRLYGNVRHASHTPHILGAVTPTHLLDSQNITTTPLQKTPPHSTSGEGVVRDEINIQRDPINYVGVTSAKRPHVGHAFLILKSFAESTKGSKVTLKLNDTGPRVAQAVHWLASKHNVSFEQAARMVSKGGFTLPDIEQAYASRSEIENEHALPKDFRLQDPNDYYRQLIASIEPSPGSIGVTSDSDILNNSHKLPHHPDIKSTLSGTGPIFFSAKDRPIVIESGGETTLKGILITLGRIATVNVTSSPKAFSKSESLSLKQSGILIEQNEGMGVSINFNVASGTKGNSLNLEELTDMCTEQGINPRLTLPALRAILDQSFFVPGEGSSINPNFASTDKIKGNFLSTIHDQAKLEAADIYSPFVFKDVTPFITKDFVNKTVYSEGLSPKGKFTTEEIRKLAENLPDFYNQISTTLQDYTESNTSGTIPKTVITEKDRSILDAMRSGNPRYVLPFLEHMAAMETDKLMHILEGTHLLYTATHMGYNTKQISTFIEQFIKLGKLYVTDKSQHLSILRPGSRLS